MSPKGKENLKYKTKIKQLSEAENSEYVVVGRLRRPHGLIGEIMMDVITDFPDRLCPQKIVYVGETYQKLQIEKARRHQNSLLLTFVDYTSCDDVGIFRNKMLYVKTDSIPKLNEGEYYHHELVGLSVIDLDSGNELGTLKEILQTGANDVYILTSNDEKEILIPAIEDVIRQIDLEQRKMFVIPPEWR